jgi:hypothetical protein
MHTAELKSARFHYNSDLSGKVIITTVDGDSIEVDGNDILSFVAEFIRMERIDKIEQLTTDELLGMV